MYYLSSCLHIVNVFSLLSYQLLHVHFFPYAFSFQNMWHIVSIPINYGIAHGEKVEKHFNAQMYLLRRATERLHQLKQSRNKLSISGVTRAQQKELPVTRRC